MTTYTSDEVLDKLIAAGLGDVERRQITPEQFKRAMAGEVVKPQRAHAPASMGKCARCQGDKENRAWTYCRKCKAEQTSTVSAT